MRSWKRTLLLLVLAESIFWQVRIVGPAFRTTLLPVTSDLYTEHHPMKWYGFSMLRHGSMPLWDPYQLCGLPFLAIPHTGVLYPGNVPYLLFDTAIATDIATVIHLVFGGFGMWLLARALGCSALGGLAAAATFSWSGWIVANIHQPAIVAAMSWLPFTLLMVERTIRGGRFAAIGLAFAVACQILNGATETFVHNMLVAGIFFLFRAGALVRETSGLAACKSGLYLVASIAAGILLAAPQLLPSMELVPLTVRASGGVSALTAFYGLTQPGDFVLQALATRGQFTFGILALLGLGSGWGNVRLLNVWLFAVVAGALSFALVTNAAVYALYYESPIGQLFRFPQKFLHMHAPAQALMAGLALTQLERWAGTTRARLWRQPAWIVGCALVATALYWIGRNGAHNYYLAASFASLLLFGATRSRRVRWSAIVALLVAHAANVFVGDLHAISRAAERLKPRARAGILTMDPISLISPTVTPFFLRPAARPGIFDTHRSLLDFLKTRAGHERVYISPPLRLTPGLTQKQGMMRRLLVTADYEVLAPRAYADFFGRASGRLSTIDPFAGYYDLAPDSRWRLMDITSTRFYVLARGEAFERFLFRVARGTASEFKLVFRTTDVGVYERATYVPRAYYVSRARALADPAQILATLDSPDFDPRQEVLIEEQTAPQGAAGDAVREDARARMVVDDPESVVVEVDTPRSGFLVLTDFDYPGWKAFVDGAQVPIQRANYLFRSVEVPAGRTRVSFEYDPASVRVGAAIGLLTLAALLGLGAVAAFRARARPGMPASGREIA
jgi:hypothetical protein